MDYKANSVEIASRSPAPSELDLPAAAAATTAAQDSLDTPVDKRVADVALRDSRDGLMRLLSDHTLHLMELLRQADAEVARRLLRAHPAAAAELATVFTVTGGIQWLSARRDGKGSAYTGPQPSGPVPPGPSGLAQSGVRSMPATPAPLSGEPTGSATLWAGEEERTQPEGFSTDRDAAQQAQLIAGAQPPPQPLALQPRVMAEQAARLLRTRLYDDEDQEDTEAGAPPGGMARRRVPRAAARR